MQIRIRLVIAWTLAMLLAWTFVTAGLPKLGPSAAWVQRFESWGYGSGFARLVGLLETAGGILVLVPNLAAYGAAIICVVMVGALYTHLSTGIDDPGFAATALVMAALVLVLRRRDARRFPARHIDVG